MTAIRTRVIEAGGKDALHALRMALPASGDTRMIAALAGAGRTVIIQRTLAGKAAGGGNFTPYLKKPIYVPNDNRKAGYPRPSGGRSKSLRGGKPMRSVFYRGGWGQYKAAIGRGSKPQLSVSNLMLGAIQIATLGSRMAALFFGSREQAAKAHGHHYGTTVPRRPFFDLSDFQSAREVEKAAIQHVRAAAKRALALRRKAAA